MASPTIAEVHTLLQAAANYCYEMRLYAQSNSKNLASLEDVVVQALETDFAPEIVNALATARASISAGLAARRILFDPIIRTYAKIANIATTNLAVMVRRLREYFETNSVSFQTRAITFGSEAASGSPAGNGAFYRLTVDKYNKAIQSVFLDAKTAVCVADANTGARKHEEVFEVRAGRAARDLIDISGSGIVQGVQCLSAASSRIANPSFSRYQGTAASPTSIEDWTPLSSIGNYALDATNYYRAFDGDGTSEGAASCSLKISGNDTLSQALSIRGDSLDPDTPYYCQIAWNRSIGTGDGTLTLHMGGTSVSVVLAAQSGWQILKIPVGQYNWLRQFNEQDLDIKVQLASRTTGYVLVDDLIFAPYQRFGEVGEWIAAVGGSTPFLLDDTWAWSDTATESKIIGEWVRAFPDISCPFPPNASPSVADPS